jgi:steroid delta-isomerase-like uncharacterized protein
MSADDIKAFVRRWFEELWNTGNVAIADELLAPTYMGHDPTWPDLAPGPEGVKRFVTKYRSAFPDFHFTIEDQIAEGGYALGEVMTRWMAQGTHQGSFMSLPPSGKPVMMTGISVHRIVDNRIVESWHEYNILGMLHQLGAIPASSSPAPANPPVNPEVTD